MKRFSGTKIHEWMSLTIDTGDAGGWRMRKMITNGGYCCIFKKKHTIEPCDVVVVYNSVNELQQTASGCPPHGDNTTRKKNKKKNEREGKKT